MKKTRIPYIQFPPKRTPIKTTFMDLIRELSQLTNDDGMVVAAVKRVFNSHNVRFGHSLTPVRLVAGGKTLKPGVRTRR